MFKKVGIAIAYLVVIGVLGHAIANILRDSAPRVIVVTPSPTPTPYVFATLTPDADLTVGIPAGADDADKTDEKNEQDKPVTPAPAATATNTPTLVPTATSTPTPAPTATNTPTPVPTATSTPTPIPTATNTPTPVPTATNTPTPAPTATNTPTPKPTATSTPKPTPTTKPEYSVISRAQIVIDDSLSSQPASQMVVSENANDFTPFADIYSVGAYGNLKKSGLGKVIDGIKLSADETLKANVISFSSSTGLGELAGTAVIDGYDFSDYDFVVIYENLAKDGSRILFRNCKFGSFQKGTSSIGTSVPFESERCTFDTFAGVNASFGECFIKNMSYAELRSGKNITISRCVFGDGSQAVEYGSGDTASLRIGSVYTDDVSTHIYVSNYTGKNRKLSIFTNDGRIDFTINAGGTAVCDTKTAESVKVNKVSTNSTYGDCFEIIIPKKLSLVLCYDNTTSGKAVQIRFVNNTGKDVLLSKGLSQKLLGK